MDYTIVRPGGLKAEPPTGALFVSGENTLNSGEISRDLVAEVTISREDSHPWPSLRL